MALRIGDIAPDFEAATTHGRIRVDPFDQHQEGWLAPRPRFRIEPQPDTPVAEPRPGATPVRDAQS